MTFSRLKLLLSLNLSIIAFLRDISSGATSNIYCEESVRIRSYSGMQHLSVLSPNSGKYDPE